MNRLFSAEFGTAIFEIPVLLKIGCEEFAACPKGML